jgi:acyl dehydratase
MVITISPQDLLARSGDVIGVSEWIQLDQPTIQAFADVTCDHQFIHVNEELARQTPFGGTIAHGFLSLSLLAAFAYDALPVIEGTKLGVNYGLDRVRFLSPVKSGARVRGRFVLKQVEQTDEHLTTRYAVTVEIEGEDRPALFAEWITRIYI